MNILIAPNSMKGSLDASAFAEAVAKGFRIVSPVFNLRKLPVADGGDFTGKVLAEALGARIFTEKVADPLGRIISAEYGIAGRTAIIEMASASGLKLIPENERNPFTSTTYGTGQLIQSALERGCRKILLGAGGSATMDGGSGMLEALGFRFFDEGYHSLKGGVPSLKSVKYIEYPASWPADTEFVVLTDVDNPLLGKNGAAAVFGPQKGASPDMVDEIESGLENWISVLETISGKPVRNMPGAGAAGGVATGLVALVGARIEAGADFIFDQLKMDEHIGWADWIITGEGRIDSQSLCSKAPEALARRAAIAGKPVSAVAGSYESGATGSYAGVFSLCNGPMELHHAMNQAPDLVNQVSGQLASLLLQSYPGAMPHHLQLKETGKLLQENRLPDAEMVLKQSGLENLASWWYLNGMLEQKKEKWGNALNCYNRCLSLDAGHPSAPAAVEMVRSILTFWNPDLYNP